LEKENMNFIRLAGRSLFAGIVLAAAAGSAPAFARVADFVGNWEAGNRNNADVASLIVTRSRYGVDVRVFGACQVRECDWGTVSGEAFAPSPNANQMQDAQTITARFNLGFAEKLVVLREARGNNVTVDVYTTFTDRSRRANYFSSQQLRVERPMPGPRPRPPGPPGQWESQWRQEYGQVYTYSDDVYYQRCRNTVDPAGVIAGALIGGLLGNAVSNGGGGGTFAGIILGGAAGAALTSQMTCEDQSYAYRAYYDGLNAGQPNRTYRWQNPRSGRNGTFQVGDYYQDRYGFNCATYSQAINVNGRMQEARGRACQQSNGTWTIVE